MEEDYEDAGAQRLSAKWASLAAPFVPSLLLSREACVTLFATPWRPSDAPLLRARRAALHLLALFDLDFACQTRWLAAGARSLAECLARSPLDVVAWAWGFATCIAALAGAGSLSAALGLGAAVRRLWFLGAAKAFVVFFYDAARIVDLGPSAAGAAALRNKASELALSCVATLLLPPDALAAHLTLCLVTAICERFVAALQRAAAALWARATIRDRDDQRS